MSAASRERIGEKWTRPASIRVRWEDPWDGTLVCTSLVPYDARMAANGTYSRWIQRVKDGAGRFAAPSLQDRIPRVRIALIQ